MSLPNRGLRAKDVSYTVRSRYLVRNVSVNITPGKVLAVLGPNGAGKSTLLKLLAGEIAPASGSVAQNGRDISTVPALALARERAVMPQATSMSFPFAVRDVVALGRSPFRKISPRKHDQELVERAIGLAEISHLADRLYPALSGGERQRVQLARALVQVWGMEPVPGHDPKDWDGTAQSGKDRFLLLDEPTAGLDVAHQHALLSVARQEAHQNGVGVLMILHDFNQVTAYADDVAILQSGSLVAYGPVEQVMQPDLLSSVFTSPIRAIPDPEGGSVLVSQAI
ncbi:heme ABC transporter ATP-binding protein [Thalassospira sp. MA62]|nr:heme ABC transporter ATP-binding protein [Thalassospira sp. MA62]